MLKFNYDNLRTMDMIVCAGKSPFAVLTRIVTVGLRYAFNYGIAVHTGMVFNMDGQKLVAEMQPKGLEINSLEKYNKVGGRRWVINIRRHPVFHSEWLRVSAQQKIALDLRRRLQYDYKGLFEFVSKRIKDNKKRAYCSEYYYQLTKEHITYPNDYDVKVSPHDLQVCSGFYTVADWRN